MTTRAHLIADVTFSPRNGPSFLACSCGAQLRSPSCEGLPEGWRAHRVASGETEGNASHVHRARGLRLRTPWR